jgi:HPt (histidine-containing phosphotransfer) domain-containing protein
MKNLEIFKIENLFHYTEYDKELASQMMQMAIVDIPVFFKSAEESLIQKKNEEARRLLHKIKGIAGVIGAERIHSLSQDCEASLQAQSDDDNITILINILKTEIELFCHTDEVNDVAGLA